MPPSRSRAAAAPSGIYSDVQSRVLAACARLTSAKQLAWKTDAATHLHVSRALAGCIDALAAARAQRMPWTRQLEDAAKEACGQACPLLALLSSPVHDARAAAIGSCARVPSAAWKDVLSSWIDAAVVKRLVSMALCEEEALAPAAAASLASLLTTLKMRVDAARVAPATAAVVSRLAERASSPLAAPWLSLAAALASHPPGRDALLVDAEATARALLPHLAPPDSYDAMLAAARLSDDSDGVEGAGRAFAAALVAGDGAPRVQAALLAAFVSSAPPTHAAAAVTLLAGVAPALPTPWAPLFAGHVRHALLRYDLTPDAVVEVTSAVGALLRRTQPACVLGRMPCESAWLLALVDANVPAALRCIADDDASADRAPAAAAWWGVTAFAARGKALRFEPAFLQNIIHAAAAVHRCLRSDCPAGELHAGAAAGEAMLTMLAGDIPRSKDVFVEYFGKCDMRKTSAPAGAYAAAGLALTASDDETRARLARECSHMFVALRRTAESAGLTWYADGEAYGCCGSGAAPRWTPAALDEATATLHLLCALHAAPTEADAAGAHASAAMLPPGLLEAAAQPRSNLPAHTRLLALSALARAHRMCGTRTRLGEAMGNILQCGNHDDDVSAPDVRFRLRSDQPGAPPALAHRALLAQRCPGLLAGDDGGGDVTLGAAVTRPLLSALLRFAYTGACAAPAKAEDAAALASLARAAGAHALSALLRGVCAPLPAAGVPPPPPLWHDLAPLLDAADASDDDAAMALLRPRQGAVVRCHRLVLAARSAYFRTALRHCAAGGMLLNELDARGVRALRRWLYTDEVRSTDLGDDPASVVGGAARLASAGSARLLPDLEQAARSVGEHALSRATPEQALQALPLAADARDWQLASCAALAAARGFPALRASGALDACEPRWAEEVRRAHLLLVHEPGTAHQGDD